MRSSASYPSSWALIFGASYFLISIGLKGAVPFAPFPLLPFPAAQGPVAVADFIAGGTPAAVRDYVSFQGVGAEYFAEAAFPCPIQRMYLYYEQRQWIADHLSDPKAPPGPIEFQVGYWIVAIDAGGRVNASFEASARGTAWKRK